MRACSAACAAPAAPRSLEPGGGGDSTGTVYQPARVDSARGGRSSGNGLEHLAAGRCGVAGRPRWSCDHLHGAEWSVDRPTGRERSSPAMAMSMSWRGWVYSSARQGRGRRRHRRGRGARPGTADPGGGRSPRGGRRGTPGRCRRCRRGARTAPRRGGTRPTSRSAGRPGAGGLRPGPVHLPGPGLEGVGRTSSRTASSTASPRPPAAPEHRVGVVGGRAGSSWAAQPTWGPATNGLSGSPPPAPATG